MIEKQREIISLLAEFHSGNLSVSQVRRISKAIIQRYPQITKKPVKIHLGSINNISMRYDDSYFDEGKPEQRQEWIDQHYVEVVS